MKRVYQVQFRDTEYGEDWRPFAAGNVYDILGSKKEAVALLERAKGYHRRLDHIRDHRVYQYRIAEILVEVNYIEG